MNPRNSLGAVFLIFFSLISCDLNLWETSDSSKNDPPEIYQLDDTKEIISSGLNRTFHIHLPSRTPGLPVVFALHGGGESGIIFKGYSGFDDAADSLRFIIVYPEAYKPYAWGESPVFLDENTAVDDLRFIRDILLKLETDLKTDPTRVYATGFSAGGFLSYALAARLPDRFAACAPLAASMLPEIAGALVANARIPTLVIHGTDDSAVYWEGSNEEAFPYLSQDDVLDLLLRVHDCGEVPEITVLPQPFEELRVRHERYRNQAGVAPVQRIIIEGGDHYYPHMLFDVPSRILAFFREFAIG